MKNYYKILQIDSEASQEVLNNAYRTLVRQYHPDLYHTRRKTQMNEKMQEINEAYNILSNASSRTEYDKHYNAHQHKESTRHASTLGLGNGFHLKKMLLWALGSFVVLRFFLQPFMANPFVKILLIVGVIYIFMRLYAHQKAQR